MKPAIKRDHYSRLKPQPIEIIESWGLGFHLGNVLKYMARGQYKGDEIRDLQKARWYLDRYLEVLTALQEKRPIAQPPEQV